MRVCEEYFTPNPNPSKSLIIILLFSCTFPKEKLNVFKRRIFQKHCGYIPPPVPFCSCLLEYKSKMEGHRGVRHHPMSNLAFHNQAMNFPPTIQVEMTDALPIDAMKTNIAIAVEGQNLVQEIVQKATALFKTLQDCEVLNLEKAGSKEKQQQLSKSSKETLDGLRELFEKLRTVYEDSRRRMPEIHDLLSSGNIEV